MGIPRPILALPLLDPFFSISLTGSLVPAKGRHMVQPWRLNFVCLCRKIFVPVGLLSPGVRYQRCVTDVRPKDHVMILYLLYIRARSMEQSE